MQTLETAFDPIDDTAENRAVSEARGQAERNETIPLTDVLGWLDSWGPASALTPPPWKSSLRDTSLWKSS